jgi:hypothetical protein
MKRALMAVAAMAATAFGLAACETATPYQPIASQHGEDRGGYSEQQIEANRFRVEFAGNSLTSRQTVERYLLFRAAQLTVNNGFDWFQSVDRHTDKQTSYYGDDFGGGWGPEWGLYRPGFGWGYGFGGFGPYGGFGYGPWGGGGFDIDQVTKYQASVEIVMGHGAKPNNPHAYDARQVIAHLQPTIKYPKTS